MTATIIQMPRRPFHGLKREINRYRALRAVGWTDGLCESCKRILWLRAGEEDPDVPPSEPPKGKRSAGEI
jgi:hypothetical protein